MNLISSENTKQHTLVTKMPMIILDIHEYLDNIIVTKNVRQYSLYLFLVYIYINILLHLQLLLWHLYCHFYFLLFIFVNSNQ